MVIPPDGGRYRVISARCGWPAGVRQKAGPAGIPGPAPGRRAAIVNNIAHASTGQVDQKTGTVTLSASARSVTVQLKHRA